MATFSVVQKAIFTYVPIILEIISKAEEGNTQGLGELAKIQKLCLDTDLAYIEDVEISEGCIHPSNRHKTGVDTVDTHGLLDTFVDDTFPHLLCNNHACFEKCTKDAGKQRQQEAFNKSLHRESDGFLPDVPVENMKNCILQDRTQHRHYVQYITRRRLLIQRMLEQMAGSTGISYSRSSRPWKGHYLVVYRRSFIAKNSKSRFRYRLVSFPSVRT